jgi:hypothetical protein
LLVLFFVPETKGKTLEELDAVFGVPTRTHAAYGLKQIPYFFNHYLLRRDVPAPTLTEHEAVDYHKTTEFNETEVNQEKRV